MQLCKSEPIGAIDDNGVGRRDIDSALDDGGAYQDVEALMVKVLHYPLKLQLSHLTVAKVNFSFWHQFGQFLANPLDGADIIVQKIDLASTANFA